MRKSLQLYLILFLVFLSSNAQENLLPGNTIQDSNPGKALVYKNLYLRNIYETAGDIKQIEIDGSYIIAANKSYLEFYKISEIGDLELSSRYNTYGQIASFVVKNNIAFLLCEDSDGFYIQILDYQNVENIYQYSLTRFQGYSYSRKLSLYKDWLYYEENYYLKKLVITNLHSPQEAGIVISLEERFPAAFYIKDGIGIAKISNTTKLYEIGTNGAWIYKSTFPEDGQIWQGPALLVGETLFLKCGKNISIYTISGYSIHLESTIADDIFYKQLLYKNGILYAVADNNGFNCFDVSDLNDPVSLSFYIPSSLPNGNVAMSSNFLYMSLRNKGIEKIKPPIQINSPLIVMAQKKDIKFAFDIKFSNDLLFVGDMLEGVRVLKFDGYDSLRQILLIDSVYAEKMYSDKSIIACEYNRKAYLYDTSDPENIRAIYQFDNPGPIQISAQDSLFFTIQGTRFIGKYINKPDSVNDYCDIYLDDSKWYQDFNLKQNILYVLWSTTFESGFDIYDIGDTSSAVLLSSTQLGYSTQRRIIVDDYNVNIFAINNEVRIYDHSNKEDPILKRTIAPTSDNLEEIKDVDAKGNLIVFTTRSGIYFLDNSDPVNPGNISRYAPIAGSQGHITMENNRIATSKDYNGVTLFGFSESEGIFTKSAITKVKESQISDFQLFDQKLYVLKGNTELEILDVSNPDTFLHIETHSFDQFYNRIWVNNRYVLLAEKPTSGKRYKNAMIFEMLDQHDIKVYDNFEFSSWSDMIDIVNNKFIFQNDKEFDLYDIDSTMDIENPDFVIPFYGQFDPILKGISENKMYLSYNYGGKDTILVYTINQDSIETSKHEIRTIYNPDQFYFSNKKLYVHETRYNKNKSEEFFSVFDISSPGDFIEEISIRADNINFLYYPEFPMTQIDDIIYLQTFNKIQGFSYETGDTLMEESYFGLSGSIKSDGNLMGVQNDDQGLYLISPIPPLLIKDDEKMKVKNFNLYQNYPNPFNLITTIKFKLERPGHVVLNIYDITGRVVNTLTNKEYTFGQHYIRWNGKNRAGNVVSSGVYFYTINVNGYGQITKKMILLK